MTKTSNKLILILGILAFIIGLLLASPAYARTVRVDSGVTFNPYVQSQQYTNNINQGKSVNTPTIITGCDNRTSGFSITTGQSCVGNYVSTLNTSTNSTNQKTTNNSSSTKLISSNTNTSKINNVTSQTTAENNSAYTNDAINNNTVTSDTNENYGSLASNALLGSNSFMPSGLVQWILFVILVLVIIFLWRYLYAEEKYMSEPVKHS